MATTEQKKKLLKAKIAVALHDEQHVIAGRRDRAVRRRGALQAPPYPTGARPQIQDAPRFVAWGQGLTVRCTAAESIRRVALIRCGSCTHAFDSDQRYVGVTTWLRKSPSFYPTVEALFLIDGL